MKPVYANYFVVRKNDTNTELVIDFAHNYANATTELDNENKLVTKLEVESETVGSFVLNMSDAIGLRDVLNNVIFNASENK
jgi:hypothetical protein